MSIQVWATNAFGNRGGWQDNDRGMHLITMVLPFVMLAAVVLSPKDCSAAHSSSFPRPHLSNRPSIIINLTCELPQEKIQWKSVHDLRLYAFKYSGSSSPNISLANMTDSMTKSKEEPSKGEKLPAISKVTFSGSWKEKNPRLSVLMPVIPKEDYDAYYCTSEYLDSESNFQNYSSRLELKKGESESRKDNFKVKVIDVDNVTVTWRKPPRSGLKFTEASMSRTFYEGGEEKAPAESLLRVNSAGETLRHQDILLETFHRPSGGDNNFSVTLILPHASCTSCQYDCLVPYTSCVGEDKRYCVCVEKLPSVATASSYYNEFIGVTIAFVFLVGIIVVVVVKWGCGKIKNCYSVFFGAQQKKEEKKGKEKSEDNAEYPLLSTTEPNGGHSASSPVPLDGQPHGARGIASDKDVKFHVDLPEESSATKGESRDLNRTRVRNLGDERKSRVGNTTRERPPQQYPEAGISDQEDDPNGFPAAPGNGQINGACAPSSGHNKRLHEVLPDADRNSKSNPKRHPSAPNHKPAVSSEGEDCDGNQSAETPSQVESSQRGRSYDENPTGVSHDSVETSSSIEIDQVPDDDQVSGRNSSSANLNALYVDRNPASQEERPSGSRNSGSTNNIAASPQAEITHSPQSRQVRPEKPSEDGQDKNVKLRGSRSIA